MAALTELFVVEVDAECLYHTTNPNTESNAKFFAEILEDTPEFPIPEPGRYAGLHPKKFFTISQWRDYSSPWLSYETVFLCYEVKRPLKLVDLRKLSRGGDFSFRDESLLFENVDGFIACEEGFEVCLSDPAEVLIDDPLCVEVIKQTPEERGLAIQQEKIKEKPAGGVSYAIGHRQFS